MAGHLSPSFCGPVTPVSGTDRPPSDVLISHSRGGADGWGGGGGSLAGSGVLSRAGSDGKLSRRGASQAPGRPSPSAPTGRALNNVIPVVGLPCSRALVVVACLQGRGRLAARERQLE